MNHRIINLLFHAACIFCLLAVFNQACFLLYERDDSRGLQKPIIRITATDKNSNSLTIPDTVHSAKIIEMIHESCLQSSLAILFQPDNTFGNQTTLYIAGHPNSFPSSNIRSGRFFSLDELYGKSHTLIAFADSWLDVYFFREHRSLSETTGDSTVVGVLELDDVLQRDGYYALAPLGMNDTFTGTWFLSSDNVGFTEVFANALRSINLNVNITPVEPLGLNCAGIKLLFSEKFFVIYLAGFLASLVNLFFYYNQYLKGEKKWNRVRYLVGARKSTHYWYAIERFLLPSIIGALSGSLLSFAFWLIIFGSSSAMSSIVIWYPMLIGGTILFFGIQFSVLYVRSDFVMKRRVNE